MFIKSRLSTSNSSTETPPAVRRRWPVLSALLSLLLIGMPSAHAAENFYFNTQLVANDACVADAAQRNQEAQATGHIAGFHCTGPTGITANNLKYEVWWSCLGLSCGPDILTALFFYPSVACPTGQNYVAPGACTIPSSNKNNGGCPTDVMKGNPCNAATGNKFQTEVDLTSVDGTIPIIRYYNSALMQDIGFGVGWTSSILGKRLFINSTTVQVLRTDGHGESFTCNGGACQGDADTQIRLTQDASGYALTTDKDGAVERYNTAGKLVTETDRNGRTTSYNYDASGRLYTVTGAFGHRLTLAYDTYNHISQITGGAESPRYTYDNNNNNLTRVSYRSGITIYHYENISYPNYLTGISYSNGAWITNRYATFTYDASGKAISTEHDAGAERYTFNYDSPTQTTVADAANTQEVMSFASNLGAKMLVAKVNQSDGKSVAQTFDANNNLTCKKDEENRVTTYTYSSTNQKLSTTEGLTGICVAPITTSATRTTTYGYLSPTLDLPTVIQSPSVASGQNKTTTIAYGDAAHPTLPTQITQSGFTPSGTPVSRGVGLTYNSVGQVTLIDGPRMDVNDVTTLAYYDCTTGGACGQLRSITNALGQVTSFDSYDAYGKLSQMTDANGLRSNYVYNTGNDYLARVTQLIQTPPTGSARTTNYKYTWAGGDLGTVYFPDGRTLSYTYNNARQLTRVTDNFNNYVAYGYDIKGNRISENTYNSSNVLARQIDLAYDIRNHVSSINAAGSLTQQINDAVGNLTQQTDPKNNPPATNSFDALNRLIQTLNSLGGSTTYAYDPNDRLQQVVAPNNATTQYQYDDLGNLLQESSTDRGTTIYTYDNTGNVTTVTDARGVVATYTYDALNRVTSIDYPGTAEDVTYTYDSGTGCTAGIGRLCQVTDASGTTQYGYDAFGNVLTQSKTELGGVYTTRYTYDAADRIKTITYPDNRLVTYARNGLGQISSFSATVSGTAKTIVSARTYRADGLLLTQSYGNGLNESRTYDLQGRLTNQALGTADTRVYGYDANGNVTSRQGLSQTGSYGYDALDRLTLDQITSIPSSSAAFGYDANGNRLSDNGGSNIYLSASNRLRQRSSQTITLDAAGNTVNDGTYTYAYNNAGELQSVNQGATTLGSYVYNHQRQRTRKTTASGTTVYHYDLRGNLILETSSTGTSQVAYVWVDTQPLAQVTKSGSTDTLSYLHPDHEGTPRLATSTTKAVGWRWEGRAFGESAPTGSVVVNLRYPGQYYDSETGLHYNNARYYDPKIGGYITVEPLGVVPGVASSAVVPREITEYFRSIPLNERLLNGLNHPYRYAYNNPLRYIDPDGLMGQGAGGGKSMSGPLRFGGGAAAPIEGPFGPVCGSGRGATWIPDGPWKDACQKHDDCYSRCGASRFQCDIDFLFDSGNVAYFIGTRVGGRPPFQNAQNESCCGHNK